MWILARYEMVALFSLKASTATGSGAKSLLLPTPYALKMALLDAACRTRGVAAARSLWPAIRGARVAVDPPPRALVTNLFAKVLKLRRRPAQAGDMDAGPFGRTIAFREYVQHVGPLGIALGVSEEWATDIASLLVQISYLGKRGGVVQLLGPPEEAAELPAGYLPLDEAQPRFAADGLLQPFDDCTPSLSFERANVYSKERVLLGRERIIRPIVLPYRQVRCSKSFTLYERVENLESGRRAPSPVDVGRRTAR